MSLLPVVMWLSQLSPVRCEAIWAFRLNGAINSASSWRCHSYLCLKPMLPWGLQVLLQSTLIAKYFIQSHHDSGLWWIYKQHLSQTSQSGVIVFTWGHPRVRWGFLPGTGLLPVKVIVPALAVSTSCQRLLKGTVTCDRRKNFFYGCAVCFFFHELTA